MTTTASRTPRSRRAGAAALAAVAALALGACGSSSDDDDGGASAADTGGATAANTASNDADAGRVRLAECLREQGIDIPADVTAGGRPPMDLDRDAIQEALEGPCADLQEDAFGDLTEEDRAEFQDRFQRFAQCLRDEGIDVPDITAGGGVPNGARLDLDDPDVEEAMAACEDVAPQGLPGEEGR